MKTVKNLSIAKPVILTKLLEDDRLVVVDSHTTVRFYDKDTFKLTSGFKVNIVHQRYQTSVVAYSNNGRFFATLSADCKESRLYNAETKKAIARVTRHQGEVSCVGVDPSSRYMFSCGDDGKTFAVDTKSGKLVFTLPHHADTINDVAFSKNGNWIATGGYDRKILLFNLVTMSAKEKLKAHSAPIMKLKFFGKNKLISVDKNSNAIIWNVYSSKILERLQGIHDDVIQIVTAEDDKFLFMGTKLGYVLLYDLVTYEQLSEKYIKITSPIVSMYYDEKSHHLIIGTEDGFLMYYNIYENREKLKTYLMNKDMDAIEEEVKKNPVLRYTDIYDMVSHLWENALKKAKLFFQAGQKEKALLVLKSFQDIPSKNRIIQKLVKDYADYDKFVNLAKQDKLALAYSLANQHPVYKESKIYQQLELRWRKVLHQALKYALQPKGIDKAKELLAPYRGVSEKTMLIQDVLTKGEIYKRFKNALGKKDFRTASELVKQHGFLREFPEYESMMRYADNLYMKADKLIYDGENVEAMKVLRVLGNFTDFHEEVRELSKSIDAKQKFYDAIEEDNYAIAYNMMTVNEDLEETAAGQKLLDEWNKDLDIANSFAARGDVHGVKETLEKYFNVSSKYAAIGTVFAWCYINQLENAMREKRPRHEVEQGIKNYILNFGVDDQIEMFVELFKIKYPDSKLDIENLKKGSLSMWRPMMIVDSILEE